MKVFTLCILSLLVLSGCSNQISTTDFFKINAVVKASVDRGSVDLPSYDITFSMTNTSGHSITFSKFDILLVNREGKLLRLEEMFPESITLADGESYQLDTSLPLPLKFGDWIENVTLIINFIDNKEIPRFSVQLPAYEDLGGNGAQLELPAMYGTTDYDKEGKILPRGR